MAASRPSGTLRHGHNGTSNSPSSTTGYFSNLKANHPRGIIAFRKYEDTLLGAHEEKERGKFLRGCHEEQVIPASLAVSDNVLELPYPPAHREALLDKITLNKRNVGDCFHKVWVTASIRCGRLAGIGKGSSLLR